MGENQQIEEENLIDSTIRVFYEGKWYLLVQYGNMRVVLEEVKKDQKVSHEIPPKDIREKLLKLMSPEVMMMKIKEPIENSTIEEKKTKSKKTIAKIIASLLLATGITASAIFIRGDYTYVGLDYEELLGKLPDDSLELQKILEENLNFQYSKRYGSFSDSEKEEFRNRAERFASYLTEEEQEIFKYQLNKVTIQKSDATNFFNFQGDSILYVYKEMNKGSYSLELAFCEMMQECYMENGKDYFIFNNQQFRDSHRVELGDHFPFYNNLLFLYYNYPEHQKELARTLGREEALYYQLMLQVLDSNLTYLPFNSQMEDVIKAYQEIFPSRKKITELLGQIGTIQSFKNDGRFYDYEIRDNVITLSSEYFIKREKQVAMTYSLLTVMEEDKEEMGEQLISEFAERYAKYSEQLEQIDQLYPIQICETWDFKSPYKREVLPHVYDLEKRFGMIPESMTEDEFENYFFEHVHDYKTGNEVETSEGEKIYIFHYPFSTR